MSEVTARGGAAPVAAASGPPVAVLGLSAASVVAAAALLPAGSLALHLVGYVLGSVVAIVAVGIFRRVDLRLRLTPGYRPRPAMGRLIQVILVGAFVVTAGHVWSIATDLAS